MITPQEIKERALKLWREQRVARAWLTGEALFPLEIPFRPPAARQLAEDFQQGRAWVRALLAADKNALGFGYRVEFQDINTRALGRQQLPRRICFDSPEDLCRFIGKQAEFARLQDGARSILAAQPGLRAWLERKPLHIVEYYPLWPRLLAVIEYFQRHPRPGRYLRELDIPGVDSKFVEQHRALLDELLQAALPPAHYDGAVRGLAGHGFERRYGLKFDPPLLRLRLLDPACLAHPALADLSVPLEDFRHLAPPCRTVFVTENKINGLSFPALPGSLVIFGLGYGLGALQDVPWLADKHLFYWGDLDTHGFAMLAQLRGYYPQARSLLMDGETLRAFRALWVEEDAARRSLADLPGLTPAERRVYDDLRHDALGPRVRLEQERLAFAHVEARLRACLAE